MFCSCGPSVPSAAVGQEMVLSVAMVQGALLSAAAGHEAVFSAAEVQGGSVVCCCGSGGGVV